MNFVTCYIQMHASFYFISQSLCILYRILMSVCPFPCLVFCIWLHLLICCGLVGVHPLSPAGWAAFRSFLSILHNQPAAWRLVTDSPDCALLTIRHPHPGDPLYLVLLIFVFHDPAKNHFDLFGWISHTHTHSESPALFSDQRGCDLNLFVLQSDFPTHHMGWWSAVWSLHDYSNVVIQSLRPALTRITILSPWLHSHTKADLSRK